MPGMKLVIPENEYRVIVKTTLKLIMYRTKKQSLKRYSLSGRTMKLFLEDEYG
jgi:hypothetical protein